MRESPPRTEPRQSLGHRPTPERRGPNPRCAVRTLIVTALAGVMVAVVPERGSCESERSAEHSRAGVPSTEVFDASWTAVERAVWTRISAGHTARLPGPCPDWPTIDTQPRDEVDSSAYTLSGRFLRQIITEHPYRTLTSKLPITITGARISGDVVVVGGRSQASITIACSTLTGGMKFSAREMDRPLRLVKVRATKAVVLEDFRSRSGVFIERSDLESVLVIQSRVDGTLSLRGSQVRTSVVVGSTTLGRAVLGCPYEPAGLPPDQCSGRYGKSVFRNVRTQGQVVLDRGVFLGDVGFQEVDVGGSVLARAVQFAKEFELLGGTIAGRLQIDGGVSDGEIYLEGMNLGGSLHLRSGRYPDLSIIGATVGRDIDLRKSKLRRLKLSGTAVRGELRLAREGQEIDWGRPGNDAHFIARNTRVASLQDTRTAWPPWLKRELDGFEYEKLGGLDHPTDVAPYLRGADWFKQWLAGDPSYSPQPYRHLSAVLRREGQTQAANAIIYEARERERRTLAWSKGDRWWLEVLRWTIGYGVGLKALRALVWMAGLALFGWVIGLYACRRKLVNPWTLLWYSISYTVPGFTVAQRDDVKLRIAARSWFYVQRLACYALALLAGAAAVGIVQP